MFTAHPSQYCTGTSTLCSWQRLTVTQYACTKMTTSSTAPEDLKFSIPGLSRLIQQSLDFTLGIISNEDKIKEMKFLLAADIKQTKLKLYYTKNVI